MGVWSLSFRLSGTPNKSTLWRQNKLCDGTSITTNAPHISTITATFSSRITYVEFSRGACESYECSTPNDQLSCLAAVDTTARYQKAYVDRNNRVDWNKYNRCDYKAATKQVAWRP